MAKEGDAGDAANALQEVQTHGEDLLKELSELNPDELSADEREQVLVALNRLTPELNAAILRLKGHVD